MYSLSGAGWSCCFYWRVAFAQPDVCVCVCVCNFSRPATGRSFKCLKLQMFEAFWIPFVLPFPDVCFWSYKHWTCVKILWGLTVSICIFVTLHTHTHTHTHTHIYIYIYTHTHTHICRSDFNVWRFCGDWQHSYSCNITHTHTHTHMSEWF